MFRNILGIRYLVSQNYNRLSGSINKQSYRIIRMSTLAGDIETSQAKRGSNLLAILEKNPKRYQRIQFLARLFEAGGYELRIAGGAVRDILRGVEPVDIDFATTARPEQSLDILQKHENIVRIIVTASGQKHGTVAVKFKDTNLDLKKIKLTHNSSPEQKEDIDNEPTYDDESPYEITTLRCDLFTDGRHAEVEFINDWKKDAERRDLTINAMFLTLNDGKLVDYFNGESDLKNGIVRFVGDADLRIREDYLRMLRFFRFWARYGCNKQPDAETLTTIEKNLVGLDLISGERIWVELKKIFARLPCYEVIKLMLQVKVFSYISVIEKDLEDYDSLVKCVLDEVHVVQKNVQNYVELGVIEVSKKDKKIKDLLPVILFAPLLKTPEICLEACKRLKFSNVERDSILFMIEFRTKSPNLTNLKSQIAMSTLPERQILMNKIRASLIYAGKADLISELDSWEVPTFPLNGHHVSMEMRKRKLPGNKTKYIIEALKNDWIASDYKSTEEELLQRLDIRLEELSKANSK